MIIKHEKGSHTSTPFLAKIWLTAPCFSKAFSFTDSCKYNLNGEDQLDWNKLTGISFNLIDARQNTVMCGWRYNIEKDNFELCAYYHISGSFNPPQKAICSVKSGERFEVNIKFNKANKSVAFEIVKADERFTENSNFEKFGICRQVNTWFGGNNPSPCDMHICCY